MITQHELDAMGHAQKDALILSLVARLDDALSRIADLEARIAELTRPSRTPDNSSVPPSRGHKPDRSVQALLRKRRGRPGVARALTENPDRVVDVHIDACPSCQASFPAEGQTAQSIYDRIELPPVQRSCPTTWCRSASTGVWVGWAVCQFAMGRLTGAVSPKGASVSRLM